MPIKVTLYEWPDSENCSDCLHSLGLMEHHEEQREQLDNLEMASVCLMNCHANDGVNCKKKKLIEAKD